MKTHPFRERFVLPRSLDAASKLRVAIATSVLGFCCLVLCGSVALAQGIVAWGGLNTAPSALGGEHSVARRSDGSPGELKILLPLHRPCEDERDGRELWTVAIPGWKARFDDGCTLFPALGANAPQSLPWSWRSVSMRVGDRILPLDPEHAQRSHTDFRYSLDYGPVVEQYDIRAEGVEQSFVIKVAPEILGDLVIEGAVTTDLRPEVVTDTHADIGFHHPDGYPILSYGKATAFDAGGARAEVRTTIRNGRITLRVAADWLAAAQFPVVIDPLTSVASFLTAHQATCQLICSQGGAPPCVSPPPVVCASRLRSLPNSLLAVYEIRYSQTSSDVYAVATTPAWQAPIPILTRVGGHASHPSASYTYANTDRWVIAWEELVSNVPNIGIYSHWCDDTNVNSGAIRINFQIATATAQYTQFHNPAVGGTLEGTHALVVAEAEDPNFPVSNRQIAYFEINSVFPTSANLLRYADIALEAPSADRRRPAINAHNHDDLDPWFVVWQQRSSVGSDTFNVVGAGKDLFSAFGPILVIGPSSADPRDNGDAKIDGISGRFLVTYELGLGVLPPTGEIFGNELRCHRVALNAGVPAVVASAPLAPLLTGRSYTNHDLALDLTTGSQFVALFAESSANDELVAVNLGLLLQTLERASVQTTYGTSPGAVTFDPTIAAFPLVSWNNSLVLVPCFPFGGIGSQTLSMQGTLLPALDRRLEVSAPNCGSGILSATPFSGESFLLQLSNVPSNTPVSFMLAAAPLTTPLNLAVIRAPGCFLHQLAQLTFPAAANAAGVATLPLPLLPYGAVLYVECPYVAPGVTPLGVALSPLYKLSIQ